MGNMSEEASRGKPLGTGDMAKRKRQLAEQEEAALGEAPPAAPPPPPAPAAVPEPADDYRQRWQYKVGKTIREMMR